VSALIAWWGDLTVLSRPMETWEAAVFGAVVGLVGQFADLCESLLKRAANTKDAGALVPEFGGLLDILDSPLLSAPVAMVLLKLWG
jgi:phosphatidate cytidylyltransferase